MVGMSEEEKVAFLKAEEEQAKANLAEKKLGEKLPESKGPNLKEMFAKHIDQIKLDYIDEQTGLTA